MSETASNDLPAEVKVENKIPAEESPPKKEEPQPAESPAQSPAQSPAPTQIKEEKENKTPKESPEPKANGEPGAAIKIPTLREQFRAFSKFGDTKSDGKHLTLSQSDKWMKQAKVIDGKTITTTDTAIHFKKFKQMKILYQDYEKYLADLAKAKSVEVSVLKNKLRSCGLPGTTGTTAVVKSQAVDRLTDSKKYTGSHKMRVESPPKGKVSPSPKK